MTPAEFIADRIGNAKWVLGRNTESLRRRYPDSAIIGRRRYAEIEREYRSLFGDPYDKTRAAMYLLLVDVEKFIATRVATTYDSRALLARLAQVLVAERNAK